MRKVSVLGITGSIGTSTLSVLDNQKDRFELYAIAAGSNWEKVLDILQKYPEVQKVVLWDAAAAEKLAAQWQGTVLSGMEGLIEITEAPEVDVVVNGLVGSVGCLPTLKALEAGKDVALANKESLVMAGELMEQSVLSHPEARLLPVDSEHNAIFQCLADRPVHEVETLQLTASGGPFRTLPAEEFAHITPERALKHPTWSMGPKITIDSATLMNKGLEVLEAHFLFHVPFDRIQVVVHPQSIVHSMVQFRDGSLMAQLGAPDMRVPIQTALSWPERWDLPVDRVSLAELARLDFEHPDKERFPCLRLAYEVGERGGTAPAILNAANEVAVPAFLDNKITFQGIPELIEKVLGESSIIDKPSLEDILKTDQETREITKKLILS